jgi:hypothetical protein
LMHWEWDVPLLTSGRINSACGRAMECEVLLVWNSMKEVVCDLMSKGAAYGVLMYLLPVLIGKR